MRRLLHGAEQKLKMNEKVTGRSHTVDEILLLLHILAPDQEACAEVVQLANLTQLTKNLHS